MSTIEVDVKSTWASKVNWAQTVGLICSFVTVFFGKEYEVPLEVQGAIVLTVQSAVAIATWIIRTFYTTSITKNSAERLIGERL